MKKEETINDVTVRETQGNDELTRKEDNPVVVGAPRVPEDKKKKSVVNPVAVGAVGGALGSLLPAYLFPEEDAENLEINHEEDPDELEVFVDEDPEAEIAPQPQPGFVGHDMPVASGVDDSMSFREAFATARREVGPGGIFAWRGHSYGTYYANEWNAMTDEEHEQYWADVYHTSPKIDYDVAEDLDDDVDDDLDIDDDNLTDDSKDIVDEVGPESDDEALVLSLHEDDIYAAADLDDDGIADIAIVDADGNEALDVIVDSTNDGNFDTLIIDPEVTEDGSFVYDEDKVIEIDGIEIIPDEAAKTAPADDTPADDTLFV